MGNMSLWEKLVSFFSPLLVLPPLFYFFKLQVQLLIRESAGKQISTTAPYRGHRPLRAPLGARILGHQQHRLVSAIGGKSLGFSHRVPLPVALPRPARQHPGRRAGHGAPGHVDPAPRFNGAGWRPGGRQLLHHAGARHQPERPVS